MVTAVRGEAVRPVHGGHRVPRHGAEAAGREGEPTAPARVPGGASRGPPTAGTA